jgi:hypothetical protein
MRRLILALMLVAALFTNAARAQTFACQYVANGGLTWEKGKWEAAKFAIRKPFFLKMLEERLIADSVAPVLFSSAPEIRCAFDRVDQGFSCSSGMGAFLYFNIRSGQGGTAFLYGSSVEYQGRRDDLQVSAFTCQKM